MRLRRVLATLLVLIAIVTPVTLALIYVHDSPAGMTPISSINTGVTSIGSNVTLKGKIIQISMFYVGLNDQFVNLSDGSGSIVFFWTETRLQVNWTVLVRGTVDTNEALHPVSDVELVLLFP